MDLQRITLGPRALDDFELLAQGAFAPLTTFMGREDYASCLERMRLADGALFPLPITLPSETAIEPGTRVALVHPRGDILATLDVEQSYPVDPLAEALALFGSADESHPYTKEISQGPTHRIAGRLGVIRHPPHADFVSLRLSPLEARARLRAMGRKNVVAFQTRNPLHRSHEELVRRAAREHDATILLHPVVGLTKPGDIDHFTRVRTYSVLVEKWFAPRSVLLALLPLAMRMGGPREALLHAIIRRNYGATHFIVGRDHAGPGNDSAGRPFFSPYEAQELVGRFAGEVGITMVPFKEMVYIEGEERFEPEDRVPEGARVRTISGTEVRAHLAEGRALPSWFTHPETAAILQQAHPPRNAQGFCVWFTGLSGAGKSTTADALRALLMEQGRTVTTLDGDEVRLHLSKGLGFSREDRDTNILRIGYVASEIVRHRGVVVCAAISPFREARDRVRRLVGEGFFEVFMDTDLATCEARDVKGLYAKARAGELKGFTGIDDPYEEPHSPEVRLTHVAASPLENAATIMNALRKAGYLPPTAVTF